MKRVMAILASLLVSTVCLAADTAPARFEPGDGSLAARIEFPDDLPEGEHFLRCSGRLKPDGRLTSVTCHRGNLEKPRAQPAIDAVLQATKQLKLVPARVEGMRQAVWFNFSVIFHKEDDSNGIRTIENHLNNVPAYGRDYIGPQRLIPDNRFPKGCGDVTLMLAKVTVDAAGNADDGEIIASKEKESARCRRHTIKIMMESRYIPAVFEGNQVPARYVEVFFTRTAVDLE